MHTYEKKTFNLPVTIPGLSQKQIEVHLALYEGYVKHTNILRETIAHLETDKEKNAYAIMEVRRRLGFEFNGMRMHEYYFAQFEGGPQSASTNTKLATMATEKYGSFENFIAHVTTVALSRGIGWTIVYHDPVGNTLHTAWVTDHELGQLGSLPIVLALDMWEHAFMVDYVPSEKRKYIDAFFQNLNWNVIEKRI